MPKFLMDFLSNESGVAAIEYGLIAGGIALSIISTVQLAGSALNANFTTASTGVNP
jgi:pilus assembly protein Flp/PilA